MWPVCWPATSPSPLAHLLKGAITMSEEKNPTTASATEHDPVIAGTPEAAGASLPPAPWTAHRRGGGRGGGHPRGGWGRHVGLARAAQLLRRHLPHPMDNSLLDHLRIRPKQPCHRQGGNEVADPHTMLAAYHGKLGNDCMDCHVPTLSEQIGEAQPGSPATTTSRSSSVPPAS